MSLPFQTGGHASADQPARGIDMLARMEAGVRAAHEATLAPLSQAEKKQIVVLMQKLVEDHASDDAEES